MKRKSALVINACVQKPERENELTGRKTNKSETILFIGAHNKSHEQGVIFGDGGAFKGPD